jgi:hypothetical protein
MRAIFWAFAMVLITQPATAQQRSQGGTSDERWELRSDRPPSPLGERDVEMRRRLDPDPTQRYRGTIDPDGSTRLRNLEGETLRGNIDSDGYGRLRDERGNPYRVRPK